MMQKLSNLKAIEHMDALMGKVSISKEAAALEDAEKNGVIAGEPAGTEQIPVTKDAEPCNKKEVPTAEGAFASEKHTDIKESTGGVEVEDVAANADGKADPVPTDFEAGSIDKESGEKIMSEQKRIQALGSKISEKLEKKASENQQGEFEKLSEEKALVAFQGIADAHYADYIQSFAAGMQKKAEDVQAIVDAKGVPQEDAAATLEEIAAEDPSLVIPEGDEAALAEEALAGEGAPAGEGGLSEEDIAMLEELASELEAAGVTPEELAAVVEEVNNEDGAAMEEEIPEAEVEKMAADRHETLKKLVRDFKSW